MKQTIEVVYGNSMTIQKKEQYENEKPLYSMKAIFELDDGESMSAEEEFEKMKNIIIIEFLWTLP